LCDIEAKGLTNKKEEGLGESDLAGASTSAPLCTKLGFNYRDAAQQF
jgi:hypothetical protein